MRNELAVQTKCVETFNDMGGHAFKSNNRFKAGILDIHCTIDGRSFFLEWKFQRLSKDGKFKVRATPKQQQFAKKEFAAGGTVIGLLFIQSAKGRNQWAVQPFDVKSAEYTTGQFTWHKGVVQWQAVLEHHVMRDLTGLQDMAA